MPRLPCRVAALVSAVVAGTAVAVGCAMSAPASIDPEANPSLPGVDAAYSATPVNGGSSGSSGSNEAADASTDAPTHEGSDASPPADAGDAAPPGPPKPAQGEVVISEIMYDPFGAEPASEWFEVANVASSARSLGGVTIKDGGGRVHTIAAGVTLAAGAYGVLVRDRTAALAAKVPSSAIVYEYGAGLPDNAGIILANGATGGLWLLVGGAVIAQAPYGGWFSQSGGSSIQLKVLGYADGAQSSSWCLSFNAWTTGSAKGTPGAAQDCP